MSFDLKSIRPTKRNAPWRFLLHADHKIGKSTFGAAAEKPIFIPTEDGLDAIETDAFDLCQSWEDVLACIGTLYSEDHGYLTVVLDSGDWAEKLACKAICDREQVDSIEGIGYGKGYVYTADLFLDMLAGLNALRLIKNMNIIIIAHSEVKRFDDPLADSYDRYQIKMHKMIGKMCKEWADIIGFAQIDSVTTEESVGFDSKKVRAIDTGRRVLRLHPSAAYDAGSRYSLPATLPLEYAAFASAMDAARNPTNPTNTTNTTNTEQKNG